MSGLADTPEPPYYAVIFTSRRTDEDDRGYARAAARMIELAHRQPGFLGVETTKDTDGLGITVSYWQSLEDIARWKADAEHRVAQEAGHARWYRCYRLRIARVEGARSWSRAAR